MAAIRLGKLTTMPAGLIYASVSVHANKEEESKKQLVKPEQLPIYTAPPLQSKYVEEQPGHLQMGFASVRTATGRYIDWCKGVYVFVKNGIMDTVQFGKDAYVYLKNPPQDFLPKMGVITVSGLVGSKFKKIILWDWPLYEQLFATQFSHNKKESLPQPKEKTKLGSSAEIEVSGKTTHVLKHSVPLPTELSSEAKTKSVSTSGATQFMTDTKLRDHGQSHPEETDMYSTRS
uniref:MICOS complex subunit n=1 Tax=Cebus imitator TaxID=2715852 RepID=A0A2K5RVW7_CEBIM